MKGEEKDSENVQGRERKMANMEDTIVYVFDGEPMSAEMVSIESITTFNGPGDASYRTQVKENN